jgi:hypothetical protein
MAVWKVRCWMDVPGASGEAGGEFPTMIAALEFADSWLKPGWKGTLTNPSGQEIDLELRKPPRFPEQPRPGGSP